MKKKTPTTKASKTVKKSTVDELEKLGGKRVKDSSDIVFGGIDETQFTFTPGARGNSWKVAISSVLVQDDLKNQLRQSGRGLWDLESQTPGVAFKAVEALLSCWENFRGLPSNEDECAQVHLGISWLLEALRLDCETQNGRKLQIAFELIRSDQWGNAIENIKQSCWMMAYDLQRPPFKLELKNHYDSKSQMDGADFSKLLKAAGLRWLRSRPRTRRV